MFHFKIEVLKQRVRGDILGLSGRNEYTYSKAVFKSVVLTYESQSLWVSDSPFTEVTLDHRKTQIFITL